MGNGILTHLTNDIVDALAEYDNGVTVKELLAAARKTYLQKEPQDTKYYRDVIYLVLNYMFADNPNRVPTEQEDKILYYLRELVFDVDGWN